MEHVRIVLRRGHHLQPTTQVQLQTTYASPHRPGAKGERRRGNQPPI
jgi:hypothetical protein